MRTQKKKIRNTLLCVLTAFTVLMLLTVLPFAETVASDDSAGVSQHSESTRADTSHEAASSAKAASSTELVSSEEAASSKEAVSSGEPASGGEPVSGEESASSEEAASSGEAVSSEKPASSGEPVSGGETASGQGADAGTPAKTAGTVSALQTGKYQYQDSDIVVSVTLSDASAIPGDAQLHVVPITEENSAKYREVEAQVAQSVQDENRKVAGFLAYDIYFMADGTRYEPEDGDADVTIRYKKEMFPPAVKRATEEIKVLHLKDTGDGTETEDVTKSVDVSGLGEDGKTESKEAPSSEASSGAGSEINSGAASEAGSAVDSEIGSESPEASSEASSADSEAASAPDGADTVEFETGSFSRFILMAFGATAQAGTAFSSSDIMSCLSPVLPFAVFANIFRLTGSEVEGCIAVNQAEINGDFGLKNNPTYYLSRAKTITVKKTYTGSAQKTFWFGLYCKKNNSWVGDPQSLTLPTDAGNNSGIVTFDIGGEDPAGYTVNELKSDRASDDNIIGLDNIYDGFKLTKAEPGTKTTSLTMNSTSYIKSFIKIDKQNCHLTDLKSPFPPPYNKLIAGAGTVKTYNQGWQLTYGSGSIDSGNYPDPDNNFSVVDPNKFPIDFDDVFKKMRTLSTDLASAVSTDTMVVKKYNSKDISNDQKPITSTDVSLKDNQMLLINIDASNQPNGFAISSTFKDRFTVNGEAIINSSGWNLNAPRIVVNVYTMNGISPTPYIGTINNAGYIIGTILAPKATVHVDVGYYNGRIVANEVDENVEVHGTATGTSGDNITWTFVNEENANYITLPETGGGGVGFYFFGGGALVLLAAAWAAFRLTRRKKGAHAGTGPFQIFGRALHRRAEGDSG